MDFNVETVSDILSLILKMDEQLDMDFDAKKNEDGSFIPSIIKISFKNPLLNHKEQVSYFSSPSAIACSAVHFLKAIRFLMAITNVSTFNIEYPNPHEPLLYYIYLSLI